MTPEQRARLGQHMAQRDKVAQQLGIELRQIGSGSARVTMAVTPDMANGEGVCHGGMIFTLVDTGFGFACNSHNVRCLGFAGSITYLAAVEIGETLTGDVVEKVRAGRTAVYDGTVTGEDGRVVATFQGTARTTGSGKVLENLPSD